MTTSSRFIRRIKANVQYWQTKLAHLSDDTRSSIEAERHNLYRAIEFGLSVPETAGLTAELVAQAFAFVERRGYWDEWEPILQQAIKVCTKIDLTLTLQNQLGFLQRLQRNLPASIATHTAVITKAKNQKRLPELATAYFYLGNTYYDDGDYLKAQQVVHLALAIFTDIGMTPDDKRMAALFNLSGLIAFEQGEYKTAEKNFNQAITHWKQTEERIYLARTLNNVGLAYTRRGQYELALHALDEAAAVLFATTSPLDQIRTNINRGVAYYHLAQWPAAESAFREANSSYLMQSGDTHQQALVVGNLGNVLLEQSRFGDAITYLEECVRLWKTVGNQKMAANAIGDLGRAFAGQARHKQAIILYDQAIQQLEKYPDHAYAREQTQLLQIQREKSLNALNEMPE